MSIPRWLKNVIFDEGKEWLKLILPVILFLIGAYLFFENGKLANEVELLKEQIRIDSANGNR